MRYWANARGTTDAPIDYDPFGVPLPNVDTPPSPIGFAGEMHDAYTGLQYLRARWYQPQTGRFTQVDPFPGLLGMPETQHPYIYGLNNPVLYTDPSGEFVGALAAAALIGGAFAAGGYLLSNPGQSLECVLRDTDFWRAVGIGMVSGLIGGAVAGFFAPLMGLATSVWTAAQIGGFIGLMSGGLAYVGSSLLFGQPITTMGLVGAMLGGAVGGAIGGALGYGLRQMFPPQPRTQPGTGGCTGGACNTAGGNPRCFVAGTQIATPEGDVAIEDIEAGDAVYALDAEGNVVISTVAHAFTRTATSLVDLTLHDAAGTVYTVTGTPEHPFYVPAVGDFVPMGDLAVGTELRGLNGEAVLVVAVQTRGTTVTVYNFEVAETHTYFVAANDGGMAVGVHNADCGGSLPAVAKDWADDVARNAGSRRTRPRMAAVLRTTDGTDYFGKSGHNFSVRDFITDIIEEHPRNFKCAEFDCIYQVVDAGKNLRGSKISVYSIGGPMANPRITPASPCGPNGCDIILKELGIIFVR